MTATVEQEQPNVGRMSAAFIVGALAGLALGFPAAYALLRPKSAALATGDDANVALLISRSQQALNNSKPDRALAGLLEAERLSPQNETVQNNLCVALIQLQRYDAAIAACNAAILLKDDFQLARNNLAWAKSARDRAKATTSARSKPAANAAADHR